MILRFIFFFQFFLLLTLTACTNKQESSTGFPGYSEGQYTYVSAYTSGLLQSISVSKGETVKEGQLLFTLTDRPLQYDVEAGMDPLNEFFSLPYRTPSLPFP